ncbi:MAG: nucleotidyltransferase domain-containing protein [Verrucomicrobiota bacterium]|nr:nucleotidyltransferase domain-containing protein [Verrucomicrobiota bacterium]
MSSKKPHIKISKSWVERFCKAHHIIKLAFFGSVLTDHFSTTSDVDILVEFDPRHVPGLFSIVEMKEELSREIGREVDLRTPEDISKLFRDEVIQQSYLVYGEKGFQST